ncbi:MAG: hypothetical protein NC241_10500 [Bacteroides sp.]|nr:hypothetical protein [Bacteroides sp.]MCM1458283.1 hypothetical protein [Lachnoclostridium sp.]
MKTKILSLVIILGAMLCIVSCRSASDRLADEITALNEGCPYALGYNTEISSIALDGSEAVVTTTLDIPDFDTESLRSSMADIKEAMLSAIRTDPSFSTLSALCTETGTSLRFTFVNTNHTRSIDITIDPSEL